MVPEYVEAGGSGFCNTTAGFGLISALTAKDIMKNLVRIDFVHDVEASAQ